MRKRLECLQYYEYYLTMQITCPGISLRVALCFVRPGAEVSWLNREIAYGKCSIFVAAGPRWLGRLVSGLSLQKPDIFNAHNGTGIRCSLVVWGIALQAERSWVRFPMGSLRFFVDFTLPAYYAPGVDSDSQRNEYQKSSLKDKGDRCVGLTTLPHPCTDFLKILGASTFWTPKSLPRPVQE
jgi:hypothetical protein